jgi:hypothetical protein
MSEDKKPGLSKRLIREALAHLSRLEPIPERLAEALDPRVLSRLLRLVQQLKAQGLANRHHRPPERLKALRELILGRPSPPSDPVDDLPPSQRKERRAQESLDLKQSNAQEMNMLKGR